MNNYCKLHYTNVYDEVTLANFDIFDTLAEALKASEYYDNSFYYDNVYITLG